MGYALPLGAGAGKGWTSEVWSFRRERLYLLPGDSPVGLRLPLDSIEGAPPPLPEEEPYDGPRDPRAPEDDDDQARVPTGGKEKRALRGLRTALCVEPRDGALYVFLPPLASAARFCELVLAADDAAARLDLAIRFEGYPPPSSPNSSASRSRPIPASSR